MECILTLLTDEYIEVAERNLGQDYSNMYDNPHVIIGTEDKGGVVGIELLDDMVWVTFLYSDRKFKTNKELFEIMVWAYEFYTIDKDIPIYFGSDRNLYKSASERITDTVYRWVPKYSLSVV